MPNSPGLVERLLSELADARAAIAASYERLWPPAERLRAPWVDQPDQPSPCDIEPPAAAPDEVRAPRGP